jgi:hypothetical protein
MSTKQPTDDMVRCPSCNGCGLCGYCGGFGGVTEDRFHAYHDTPLDAEDQRILRMSRPELEVELAKEGLTFDEAVSRVDCVIERAKDDAAAHLTAEKALRDILMVCDEAPTEHNAWVVEIQGIARATLKSNPA